MTPKNSGLAETLHIKYYTESDRRGSRLDSCGSLISSTNVVSTCAETCFGRQLHSAESGFAKTRKSTSGNINADGGFQIVREQLIRAGIPTETAAIIGASWRPSTSKQYGPYFKMWVHFCIEQQIDVINPS